MERGYEYVSENFLKSIDFFTPINNKEDLQKQENEARRIDLEENDEIQKSGLEDIRLLTSRLKITDNEIILRGMDFSLFLNRVKLYYNENSFNRIFIRNYTKRSEKQWERRKIRKKDMKIKNLSFPLFFALEISMILDDLGTYFKINYYKKMAKMIREKTWVGRMYDVIEEQPIDISKLNNIKYELKPYQKEFVQLYPTLKYRFNLIGFVLSFDQGLGKTLTSLSLSECLNKELVIICCPNSIKDNWANEGFEYFNKYHNNISLWREEWYVHGNSKFRFNDKTKYIVVNHEAIDKIIPLVKGTNKDTMIIVDESHYFRNMTGKRTSELLSLKEATNCKDNLMMSGTPIKAIPNEIIPTLMMIDPLFTEEIANIYRLCFNVDGIGTKNIVNSRFGIIMHRRLKKDVLTLPPKKEYTLRLKVSNPQKYLSSQVSKEIGELFEELMEESLKTHGKTKDAYIALVKAHHKAPRHEYNIYMNYLKNLSMDIHELDQDVIRNFTKLYIYPFLTSQQLKHFKDLETAYIRIKERCMGRAIGAILPKRKTELFIDLFDSHKDKFIEMIDNNPRKTIIFSSQRGVVDHIEKVLQEEEIGVVKIVGGTENRMDKILEFKNSDDIQVIVASFALATGVTLTEANQVIFFSKDYRDVNNRQAMDRAHRIGQTEEVSVFTVLLDSGNLLNISTKADQITRWSAEQFDAMMNEID